MKFNPLLLFAGLLAVFRGKREQPARIEEPRPARGRKSITPGAFGRPLWPPDKGLKPIGLDRVQAGSFKTVQRFKRTKIGHTQYRMKRYRAHVAQQEMESQAAA